MSYLVCRLQVSNSNLSRVWRALLGPQEFILSFGESASQPAALVRKMSLPRARRWFANCVQSESYFRVWLFIGGNRIFIAAVSFVQSRMMADSCEAYIGGLYTEKVVAFARRPRHTRLECNLLEKYLRKVGPILCHDALRILWRDISHTSPFGMQCNYVTVGCGGLARTLYWYDDSELKDGLSTILV